MFSHFLDNPRRYDVLELAFEDAGAARPVPFVRFDNLGRPLVAKG